MNSFTSGCLLWPLATPRRAIFKQKLAHVWFVTSYCTWWLDRSWKSHSQDIRVHKDRNGNPIIGDIAKLTLCDQVTVENIRDNLQLGWRQEKSQTPHWKKKTQLMIVEVWQLWEVGGVPPSCSVALPIQPDMCRGTIWRDDLWTWQEEPFVSSSGWSLGGHHTHIWAPPPRLYITSWVVNHPHQYVIEES